jgi:hypothetical protein
MTAEQVELTAGVLASAMEKYLFAVEQVDLSKDFLSIVSEKLKAAVSDEEIEGIAIPQVVLQESAAIHGLLLATLAYSYEPHINGTQVASQIKLPLQEAAARFRMVTLAIIDYMRNSPEEFEAIGEIE